VVQWIVGRECRVRRWGMAKAKKPRVDKATTERRVDDVYRLRLRGISFPKLREFVRAKEKEPGSAWELKPDEEPAGDSTLRRYITLAINQMVKSRERSRRRKLALHLGRF
jgi:hypothetical protein